MSTDRLTALAERARALAVPPTARTRGADWFRIANAKAERAEVWIYGAIGSDWDPDDVTAGSFVQQLRDITAPAIDLHINSPGGLVFDGIAIYSALKNHAATVDVSVDGIAASAASFIAMAGDSVAVEKPAKLMIHDAGGLVIGNAADMRQMADLLDELSDTIAAIYADRAGTPAAKWREAMRAETWYSAAEAVKAGLADRVANDNEGASNSGRTKLIRARARVTLGRVT